MKDSKEVERSTKTDGLLQTSPKSEVDSFSRFQPRVAYIGMPCQPLG
jgi:hypothetical protein